MGLYQVLLGQHIGPDYSQQPRKTRDALGNETERYPSKTYQPGETVDSDLDLVARFGEQKFRHVGESSRQPRGSVTPATPAEDQRARTFPGGQVLEGFQRTTSAPDGRPVSGLLDPQQHAELQEKHAARIADDYEAAAPKQTPAQGQQRPAQAQQQQRPAQAQRLTDEQLHSMTVKDLQDHAAAEEIDLKGATRKEDMIRAIRGAK